MALPCRLSLTPDQASAEAMIMERCEGAIDRLEIATLSPTYACCSPITDAAPRCSLQHLYSWVIAAGGTLKAKSSKSLFASTAARCARRSASNFNLVARIGFAQAGSKGSITTMAEFIQPISRKPTLTMPVPTTPAPQLTTLPPTEAAYSGSGQTTAAR